VIVTMKMRPVYQGRPGKSRLTKKWAYRDAAWLAILRNCDCDPGTWQHEYCDGNECSIHKRLRWQPEVIGYDESGDKYGPDRPRHGKPYFIRVANRLASIYAALDRREAAAAKAGAQ
jgi:hypothetical protein